MSDKRLIDANVAIENADKCYREWNLAMAAAEGNRQINMVYKKQELFKAVKKVVESCDTIDPETLRPQWISTKDRLPNADEGDDFLAVSKNGNFVFEAYFVRDCGRGKNLWHDGSGNFYEVTHWMPLPEPPAEE